MAQHLRRAAELVAGARSSSDMRDATDALADGMRAVGLYRWRTQLNNMAAHIELVANADDPRGNDMVRQIANSLGMSAEQRRILHDQITG